MSGFRIASTSSWPGLSRYRCSGRHKSRAVRPCSSRRFGSAPWVSWRRTLTRRPFWAARRSACLPNSASTASTGVPASTSRSIAPRRWWSAAMTSARMRASSGVSGVSHRLTSPEPSRPHRCPADRREARAGPSRSAASRCSRAAQRLSGDGASARAEIRPGGKSRHDVSVRRPAVREPGQRRTSVMELDQQRWTQSCPRTRKRPLRARPDLPEADPGQVRRRAFGSALQPVRDHPRRGVDADDICLTLEGERAPGLRSCSLERSTSTIDLFTVRLR
jgi:hypothetical protein